MNQVRAAFLETLRAVFSDRYAVVTLIGAVVLYSFFYPVAYRHQVASQYPVLVVDLDHSAMSRALVRNVAGLPPGETVRLTLQRGGRQQEIAVQIGRRPSEG